MDIKEITELVKKNMADMNIKDDASFKQEKISDMKAFDSFEVNLVMAKVISDAVMKKAEEIGVKAVCAVVNKGARPVLVECADDSFIASYDIALNKAFTSVSLKMKTKDLSKLARPDGSLYGIQNTNDGRIVIFGGGTPLKRGDTVIGGFGVSGGTAEQDTFLGDYAEEVFNEICVK